MEIGDVALDSALKYLELDDVDGFFWDFTLERHLVTDEYIVAELDDCLDAHGSEQYEDWLSRYIPFDWYCWLVVQIEVARRAEAKAAGVSGVLDEGWL